MWHGQPSLNRLYWRVGVARFRAATRHVGAAATSIAYLATSATVLEQGKAQPKKKPKVEPKKKGVNATGSAGATEHGRIDAMDSLGHSEQGANALDWTRGALLVGEGRMLATHEQYVEARPKYRAGIDLLIP